MISFSQTFFEKNSDVVGDPLELLVALGLRSFQTPSYMSAYKWHGYGVGTGAMAAGITVVTLWRR